MKQQNNKGSALMQVLVLGALISTIVVVLLKFSVTRMANMVQTKTLIGSNTAVQDCLTLLNEEETRRIESGILPYFADNTQYSCSFEGYDVTITRGNTVYATIVNGLNIDVTAN